MNGSYDERSSHEIQLAENGIAESLQMALAELSGKGQVVIVHNLTLKVNICSGGGAKQIVD